MRRAAAILVFPATRVASDARTAPSLVVHEWGTFTSVAGANGDAAEWRPQGGASDLPCFVKQLAVGLKGALSGTVRLETPVLYFYAPERMTACERRPGGMPPIY